ncbi:MAG TPA: hypothetical protein VFQ39_11895 [Longimicrobium sp.]|nr:hypothetical protein [Longimicrobium sp.]
MGKLPRRIVLAASFAAIAFAAPATLLSKESAGPSECEITCISRYQACVAAGNPEPYCDRLSESCLRKCEIIGG